MNNDKRHTWSEADDARLAEAVTVCSGGQIKRIKFWSAVAGRLLPDLAVTPDACRTRWDRLHAIRVEEARVTVSPEAERRWREVAERVEQAEKDRDDWLLDAVIGLRDEVTARNALLVAMESRMAALEAEVRRLREMWS